MKLGDQWRLVIEKDHREKLKMREAELTRQQMVMEQETASALPKEAVTK